MTVLDWLVIALYGIAMLAIGRYYGMRTETSDDYHLGGRRMSPWAIGLSLFATLTSALSYLAVPGEMIKHGPMMLAQLVAFPVIAVVVGWGLIPFIMRQQMTSAHELLERRLGLSVRVVGSLMFLSMRLAWMATILYATADKVLAPLLGLGPGATLAASIVMCVITLIYTAEGGMRAVVMTDAMQSLIMLGGATLVIVVVTSRLGGWGAWWPGEWAPHWDAPRLGFDASTRMTFSGAIVSSLAWYVFTLGSDQMAIQRWLSTRDAAAARRSLFMSLVTGATVTALLGLVGFAVLGYSRAHPELFQSSGDMLADADKLFPRFIVGGLPPGVTGILMAAVIAAAMSSLSSGMNSSCAVITEDFIGRFRQEPLSNAQRLRLARFISVGVGVLAILLSVLVGRVQGNLLDLCYRVVNLLVSPLFVLFFLAMFVPWGRTTGALVAAATSLVTAIVIAFSQSLGLGAISILWIMPASFAVGAFSGALVSLVPIGRPASATDRVTWPMMNAEEDLATVSRAARDG